MFYGYNKNGWAKICKSEKEFLKKPEYYRRKYGNIIEVPDIPELIEKFEKERNIE